MGLTRFLEFAENQERNQSQGVVAFGAYWPGIENVGLFPQTFTEADKVDVVTTSKTPIMFDIDDVEWLSQFPPQFATAALAMRYGSLLVWAVEKMKKGEPIPDRAPITFIDRNTSIEFSKSLDGEEDIPLGMDKLIKRLTKSRDLEAFHRMKPGERDKYKGGTLGYNLENIFTNPQTGEKFADAYIAMTQLTARQVMEAWRHGMTAGFLKKGDPFSMHAQFQQVGFGGGAPKEERAVLLDWDGTLRQQSPAGLWLPVRTGEFLSDKIKSPITDRGEVLYRFERDGTPQEVRAFVPAWQPGRLVDLASVHQYNNLIDEVNRLMQLHGDPNHKSIRAVVNDARSVIQGSRTYDEFDYNVHRFNKETDEKGHRLYPRLYTHNTAGIGIVQPHANQPETIQGTKKDADTIRSFFHIHQGSSAQPLTMDPSGSLAPASAVGSGIKDFIYDLLKKYNDPEGATTLNSMYDDIFQVASSYLERLAGEPLWADAARILRDKEADPDDKERIYKKTAKDIRRTIKHWTSALWQLDWGQGTRRQRQARAKKTANAVARQTLELRDEIAQGGKSHGLSDEDLARLRSGRLPGERNTEVRPESPRIGKGNLPASMSEIGIGHHIATIRRRAADIAARSAALQQERQSGMGKIDLKTMMDSLAKDAQNRNSIFNQLVQAYIFTQIQSSNLDFDMRAAYDWADIEMDKILKGSGIKVEKGIDQLIAADDKELDAEMSALKQEIIKLVDEVKDMVGDETMSPAVREFFKQYPISELIENPEMIKRAYEELNELERGEVLDDDDFGLIKDFLADAKKHADALKGKDTMSIADKARHAKHLGDEGKSATSELEDFQVKLQSTEYLEAIAKSQEKYKRLKKIALAHPELPLLMTAIHKIEEMMQGKGQTVPTVQPKLVSQPAPSTASTEKIDPDYFLADLQRIGAIARNEQFLDKIRRLAITYPEEPRWQQIIDQAEQMKKGTTPISQQKPVRPRIAKKKPAEKPGGNLSQGTLF